MGDCFRLFMWRLAEIGDWREETFVWALYLIACCLDCQAVDICTSSEYRRAPATASTDAQCVGLRECSSTEFETQVPTLTSNRMCQTLTTCTAGQETVSRQPTLTSDRCVFATCVRACVLACLSIICLLVAAPLSCQASRCRLLQALSSVHRMPCWRVRPASMHSKQ